MHAVAVASGELSASNADVVARLRSADLVIAIDGGIRHCAAVDIAPDLLVGDLDSAPAELVAWTDSEGGEIVRFPEAKDETDLELGLTLAAARGATSINAIGVFGGRVDHQLANIGLIASRRWVEAQCVVWSDDGRRSLYVVTEVLDLALPPGVVISLVPWGSDVWGLSATGVRWLLDGDTLPVGTPRGVSNETTEPTQRFAVESGTLLVIVDRTESNPDSESV